MVMKSHTLIGVGSVIVLVAAIVGVTLLVHSTAQAPSAKTTSQSTSSQKGSSSMELQSTDETVGTGAEAVAGKSVTVNYVGTLENLSLIHISEPTRRTPI